MCDVTHYNRWGDWETFNPGTKQLKLKGQYIRKGRDGGIENNDEVKVNRVETYVNGVRQEKTE